MCGDEPSPWRADEPPKDQLIVAVFEGFPHVAKWGQFHNEYGWHCYDLEDSEESRLEESNFWFKDPEMWLPMPIKKDWEVESG